MASPIDIGGLIRGARERVAAIVSADKAASEMLEILRDTHRILRKLEDVVDDLASKIENVNVSPERIARMEQAIINIERATGGVEGAINALPRAVRERIWPSRAE